MEKYQICINPKNLKRLASFSFFLSVFFLCVVLEHLLLAFAYISPRLLYFFLPKTGVSFYWESGICMFAPGIARFFLGVPYVLPGFRLALSRVCTTEGAFDHRSVLTARILKRS